MLRLFLYRKNLYFLISVHKFHRTNAVGASVHKMNDRLNDFGKLMQILKSDSTVLEFGSGFSTYLFHFSKKIKSLTTVEEFLEYLPPISDNSFKSIVLQTQEIEYNGIKTKKFGDTSKILKEKFDLIYIDGPQTPSSGLFAAPNIDIFNTDKSNLIFTIIAIDVRFNTVIETHKLLSGSHRMYLSRRFKSNLNKFENLDKNFVRDYEEHGFGLKLTTLFIPRTFSFTDRFTI